MSWLRYMTLYSFRHFHPDWDINLYINYSELKTKPWATIIDQDFFNYKGSSYYNKIEELNINIIPWELSRPDCPVEDLKWKNISPSQKSNFFKWKLLGTDGGVYSDMDILYINSIDKLFNQMNEESYDTVISYSGYYSIGFMMSCPENAFFKAVFDTCFKLFKERSYQGAGVDILYSKWKNVEKIEEEYPNLKIYKLPMPYFYYNDCQQMVNVFKKVMKLPEEVLGIHWYAGTKLAQEYNNLVNENNYKEYQCTLTNYLEKII